MPSPGGAQREDDAEAVGVGQAEVGHHAGDGRVGEGGERRAQPIRERDAHGRFHARQGMAHGRRVLGVVLDEEDMQPRNRLVSIHHILPPSLPVVRAWTAREQCEATTP